MRSSRALDTLSEERQCALPAPDAELPVHQYQILALTFAEVCQQAFGFLLLARRCSSSLKRIRNG